MARPAPNDGMTPKERYLLKKHEDSPMVMCACGCGQTLKQFNRFGREAKYVSGHNGRKFTPNDATRSATARRYRLNNPEKIKEGRRDYYRALKIRSIEHMGGCCVFCGLKYDGKNGPVFEFHHTDPKTKDSGLSRMFANKAWATVLEELAKCVLSCANCHNQFHGGEW